MFTGITTGVGRIVAVHALHATSSLETSAGSFGKRLLIAAPVGYLDDVGLGDNIAINGACMTVTSFALT
jgi:riboflavin synthase